ncbi:MAG: hypothetical protein ACI4CS_03505 [Candidatus Weimeria sp.]
MKCSFLKRFTSIIMTAALAVVISIPAYASTTLRNASWEISALSSSEQTMYDHLVSELERIISQGGSTEITFDGLQFDTDDASVAEANAEIIWDRLYTYVSNNHPELLFFEEINSDDENPENMTISSTSFSVKIGVNKKYRGADEYTLSTGAATVAESAKSVADSVISANSGKSTYDTIKAYADWIADNVSYDHSAAALAVSQITDSSPWNLISVFDQDSSTNVVCEGYAKAFQYLMDNTPRFVSAGVRSKIVTSTVPVSGSSSVVSGSATEVDDETGHMWNVVTIGGKNYIVDVTWYDTDSSESYRTKYLLGGKDAVESDTTGLHEYDSDTTDFYSDDELELSDTAYDESSADPVTPGASGDSGSTGTSGSTGGSTESGSANTGSTTGNTSSTGTTTGNTSSTGNTSTTGNTSSTGSTTGNTSSTGNTGSTSSTGSTTGNTSSTGTTTGNTSSTGTTGSTSSTGTTGTTSQTSGSSSSSSSAGSTNDDTDTATVTFNTTGAQPGGDQPTTATITYTAPQTGDTSYPFDDTAEAAEQTQISTIESKKESITGISTGSRKLTIKFKKITVSGKTVKYQVAIKQSASKSWKKSYIASTKKTFSGLKKGGTYWVSVRPYITVDGTRYFGKWSKTLTKKVK